MVRGDRFNKNSISFKQERCLYSRSVWTRCTLCIDSCPANAIQKPPGSNLPTVDKALCVQCGQCLSACQLEAFESSSFSERQLLSRIDSEQPVSLACFLYKEEKPVADDSSQTYRLGTCLAALTPGALFELSFSRECTVLTNQCRTCSFFSSVAQTLKSNMRIARLLLSDFGVSAHLSDTARLFISHEGTKPAAVDGSTSSLIQTSDDPDIHAVVSSSIRSLFHSSRTVPNKVKAPFPLKTKRHYVPSWKSRLKDYWLRRRDPVEGVYPWPVLSVDRDCCKACGTCMQLCPTGSVRHDLSEGEFRYSFVPGTCLDCGLCIMSCVFGALSREYRSEALPFEARECLTAKAQACVRCGLPALNSDNDTLCYLCLSEPDPKSLTERVKRQMQTHKRIDDLDGERLP